MYFYFVILIVGVNAIKKTKSYKEFTWAAVFLLNMKILSIYDFTKYILIVNMTNYIIW